MLGLGIAALIKFEQKGNKYKTVWDKKAIGLLFRPWTYPSLGILTLLFWVVFISIWQGGDIFYWLDRLRVKAPLLIIPLMFLMFPRFTQRQVFGLFYLLLLWMTINCLGVGINYLFHIEEVNLLIKQGQSIPTPGNHISFSLLTAYSVICGAYLYQQKYFWKYQWERKLMLILTLFLFIFLHLLAVRSGLIVLYATTFVMAIYYTLRTKKIWIGLAVISTLALIPVASYYYIPSFRAKIEYVSYDRWMHEHGEGALYADSGRITSLIVGYEIFKQNPVFGVGVGHMKKKVDEAFKAKRPESTYSLMPHNQMLYTLTATGLLGLGISLIAFLFPLFYRRNYQHPMLLASYSVFISMAMLEHNLENSVGLSFCVFCFSLLLNLLNKENPMLN